MQSRKKNSFVPAAWDQDSEYEGARRWSYRRWAWEFLRRNAEYQAACTSASRVKGADHSAEGAKFGRSDLRPFWLEYHLIDDGRSLWLAESVEMVGNVGWSIDESIKPLKNGHVAIIFDLTQTATAGTAALASMRARADELLRHALAEFARWTKEIEARPKQFKPITRALLEKYLRLYDAIEIFGAPQVAIIETLYPQYWDRQNQCVTDGVLQDAQKSISKNLGKAREMVEWKYKTLVPLDITRADEERRQDN
jgi:hypothetical protein